MPNRKPLAAWDAAVSAYLANRRASVALYENDEYTLNRLRRFLVNAGASDLDEQLFDRWRASFYRLSNPTRIMRKRAVHRFCRYRRRREPHCFLPDPNSFTRLRSLPLPRIIEHDQVVQLLRYVSALVPTARQPLRPAALRLAILLLYTAGLRRGELVRLTLGDVDAQRGVLFIRDSKFHKSRWVPLSASVRSELRRYLDARRRAGFDTRAKAPLICHTRGNRVYRRGLWSDFKRACWQRSASATRTAAGRACWTSVTASPSQRSCGGTRTAPTCRLICRSSRSTWATCRSSRPRITFAGCRPSWHVQASDSSAPPVI